MSLFDNRKNIWWIVYAILAILLSAQSAREGGDFDVYLQGAEKMSRKANPYRIKSVPGDLEFYIIDDDGHREWVEETRHYELQYFYSPLFAMLLIPFVEFKFFIEFLWLLLSFALLIRIANIIQYYFDPDMLTPRQGRLWVIAGIVLSARLIPYNITMIQINIFIIWAAIEAMMLIRKKHSIIGGALLALAINIKLLPLVFVPYLAYRAKWKALAIILFCSVVYLFIPAAFMGWDYNRYLLYEWWFVINPLNAEHVIETDINTHSLVAWIPNLLTETSGSMDLNRNIANLPVETSIAITNVFRVFLVGLFLWILRSVPFKPAPSKMAEFREISYLLWVIPLIFPHQQKYAFISMLPAIIYVIYGLIVMPVANQKQKVILWLGVSFVLLIFTPLIGSDIIGRYTYNLLQYYKVLTISGLAILPILLIFNPDKIELWRNNMSRDEQAHST
ncbi:MAG TPA: hypothetical protein DDX92_11885 [Flavobacteriales bacterium]|jgi:hypothetical protein|nr:hypothetical protein [Flavobacteriales bacterium]